MQQNNDGKIIICEEEAGKVEECPIKEDVMDENGNVVKKGFNPFNITDTRCDLKWLIANIVIQIFFILSLFLNIASLIVMRIQLVNRIKHYFYYKTENDVALKY